MIVCFAFYVQCVRGGTTFGIVASMRLIMYNFKLRERVRVRVRVGTCTSVVNLITVLPRFYTLCSYISITCVLSEVG